jgi:membrane glycosyltransferase
MQQSNHYPLHLLRGPLYVLLVLLSTAYGATKMFSILQVSDNNILNVGILLLFSLCFAWISTAFWGSLFGAILFFTGRDPLTLQSLKTLNENIGNEDIYDKTALVMPIYNEDTDRVMAGVEATLRSLENSPYQRFFDFYLLSDTTDEQIAIREATAWKILKKRLSRLRMNFFYRRRDRNLHRKVGNIADFCKRWGHHYEHMIVLDADSIMGEDAIISLVRKMQNNPEVGLIQTLPRPVRQKTFFGRFLQFSGELYTPILATGNCFWQTNTGNYWGHNAIIRTKAFIECCGLPTLVGRPPFGGEILSHDFVEAALLKRGGWQVITSLERVESYEEVPSNIIDFIIRDRRWAQGNIQHLKLLPVKGLHWISRIHMLFGAMSYISSLLWLIMIVLSTIAAILIAIDSNEFFSQPYQLFPNWRVFDSALIYSLFTQTVIFLLFPKFLSLAFAFFKEPEVFGGRIKLVMSALLEIFLSIIIAPIMMTFHAYVVIFTIIGKKVTWNSQPRNGRAIPWREAFGYTFFASTCGLVWGGLSFFYAPAYFWWMLPVLLGLVFAAPIVRYSGSFEIGEKLKTWGLLLTPSEQEPSTTLSIVDLVIGRYHQGFLPTDYTKSPRALTRPLPEESYNRMPVQPLR